MTPRFLLPALFLSTSSAFAATPSYNCAKAQTEAEHLVCGNDGLAVQDVLLAKTFSEQLKALAPADKESLKKAQRQWVKAKDAACGLAPGAAQPTGDVAAKVACLKKGYEARIEEVAAVTPAGAVTAEQSQTLTFIISPTLPKFRFEVKFHPNSEAEDFIGVSKILVFKGDAPQPLQTLELVKREEDLEDMTPHIDGFLSAADMNFDGYLDLNLISSMGATGNASSRFWLYNPGTGQFEFNNDLSNVTSATPDPKRKVILSHENGGMGGAVYGDTTLRWDKNKLVVIEVENQEQDPADESGEVFIRSVSKLKDGKLVEVSRKKVKPGNE